MRASLITDKIEETPKKQNSCPLLQEEHSDARGAYIHMSSRLSQAPSTIVPLDMPSGPSRPLQAEHLVHPPGVTPALDMLSIPSPTPEHYVLYPQSSHIPIDQVVGSSSAVSIRSKARGVLLPKLSICQLLCSSSVTLCFPPLAFLHQHNNLLLSYNQPAVQIYQNWSWSL